MRNVGIAARNRPVYHQDDNSTVDMAPETVSSSGGGAAHENMQPYLTLNFCIALQGLYPSRS
jgi:microcystin-dependent protein